MQIKKVTHWILLLLYLAIISCGCLPVDYEGKLPNGYILGRNNNLSLVIFSRKSGSSFSEEYITKMNIKEDIVFGKIDTIPPDLQRLVIRQKRHPGYFILDTKTGLFQLGLEKQKWLEELEKLGISEEPTLMSPSAFRNEPAIVTIVKAIFLGQR